MKHRLRGILYLGCSLVVALTAVQTWVMTRATWRESFGRRGVDLAAFCRLALDSRADLMISGRFAELTKDSDIQWVLIQDANGRVGFSTSAGEIGTTLDSPRAKAASGATDILLQDGPGSGQVEVDVPLGKYGVLRISGSPNSASRADAWLAFCGAIGVLALLAAGWQAMKAPPPPPPQEPAPEN